ncbi:trihelix transcription factor GT-3b [Prunus yedoensis var. nudiflora]|uniref:Trihelix transcription factor GT-3b n=1 Tax=Prunus yedoensis var. nudiflora TaxID=2094558 RepID=A0A314ZKQ0_PRUYE|nr:trihelix transcription factor GT-3b [Prunus yedoensis var. nudiflora]
MYGAGGDEEEGMGMGMGSGGTGMMKKMMTSPAGGGSGQWAPEETRELIAIRGELEIRNSNLANRSKALWEAVSSKMAERGFNRTPEQCKCKWKNLLTRYKGKETSDPESGRECPFFEELQAVFTERANNMQRLLLESETGSARSKKMGKRKLRPGRSSDEFSEDPDEEDEDDKKRKGERVIMPKATNSASATSSSSIQDMLKAFFQQQQRMEMEWREMMERREQERRMFEQEWRQKMEKVERERLMVEQAWREREEQRRMREESRAERRDALLTTLLNKLINQTNF